MDRREAAFHPSAEQYREQAKLARRSGDFESNADEQAKLLVSARQYEQLAASLERMRGSGGGVRFVRKALIFILVLSAVAQSARADWLMDARTQCRVWNEAPQQEETVTWSGACQNGEAQGRGVMQWFQSGQPKDRYEGQVRAGKPEGHGILIKPNGNRFEGEWRDGKANGLGHINAGDREFRGIWKSGCAQDGETWIGIGRSASTCP